MDEACSRPDQIFLTAPGVGERERVREVANCLSRAFSSGLWETSPMPLGPPEDSYSALGIIDGLGPNPVFLAAHAVPRDQATAGRIIGCVVGTIMDDQVIDRYRLASFHAKSGDGLLAFIGIVPEAQRIRIVAGDGESAKVAGASEQQTATSLARHLFASWLAMDDLGECRNIFVRTRRKIAPVLHLCDKFEFSYRGSVELQFRGNVQERLVFCRKGSLSVSNSTGAAPNSSHRKIP